MITAVVIYIVVSCVLAIHLGLIDAIEEKIKYHFIMLNCPKCLSFWLVLAYLLCTHIEPIVAIATAFICSYAALWLELLLSLITMIYNKLYEIVNTKNQDKMS